MLTLSAAGVIHHRGGQRRRLDQSQETKWRGRLRPDVVCGHHPGEKQQRCRHLHLKSRCLLLLSTHPPLLSISPLKRRGLHEHFICPSALISVCVLLFVPLPSFCCHICGTRRGVSEHRGGTKHSSVSVRASHLACCHGYTTS